MQPNACSTRKPQKDIGNLADKPEQHALPHEFVSVLWPALQIGGLSGVSGLLFGSVRGILRSTSPTLVALASGIEWFTAGSTYWAVRTLILNARGKDKLKPSEKVSASSVAGGIAGCAGGLLRGRRNVIPITVLLAILGGTGQTFYNTVDAQQATSLAKSETESGWLDSKWSPVKVLSDDEYEGMLQEKLLRLKAEIALVDESIIALKSQGTQNTAQQIKARIDNKN